MKALIPIFIIFSFFMLNCSELNQEKKELTKNETNDALKGDIVLERNPLWGQVSSIKEQVFTLEEKFGEYKRIGEVTTFTYKFNENVNLVEMVERTRDEYGSNYGSFKTTFKYNDLKKLIEENYFELSGRFINKTIYKYDEIGNLIEEKRYNADGDLSNKRTYKYKNKGREVKGVSISPTWPDGNSYRKFTCKYNNKGLLIEEKEYNTKGNLSETTTYKYNDFDETGNWIKQSVFINDKPRKIIEREIKYSN